MHTLIQKISVACLVLALSPLATHEVHAAAPPAVAGDVLISEICTDPQQDWSTTDFSGVATPLGAVTSSDEYIEITNTSTHVIDLTGWHLIMTDSGVDDAVITADLVKNEQPAGDITHFVPGAYLTLGNPVGSMNNDVLVEIYDGAKGGGGKLMNKVTLGAYDDGSLGDNALTGDASSVTTEVMARHSVQNTGVDSVDFFKTSSSMGAANPETNHPPAIVVEPDAQGIVGEVVQFDASASADPDGDALSFSWDFDANDGVTSEAQGALVSHAYATAGTYIAHVHATDTNGGATDAQITVMINAPPAYSTHVAINEVYFLGPSTAANFIEFANTDTRDVDLDGWIVRNQDAGKEVTLPAHSTIAAGKFLSFKLATLGLNTGELDEIILQNPNHTAVSRIIIGTGGKGGESFAASSQGWAWSTTPTPGSSNIINRPLAEVTSDWPSLPQPQTQTAAPSGSSTPAAAAPTVISRIAAARALQKNTTVTVRGVVTALPGFLSETTFFIQDSQAGIKISSSKKDFPPLAVGDLIQVTGKISPSASGVTLSATKIEVVSHSTSSPEATLLTFAQLDDTHLDTLVRITGEFVKQTSAYITIKPDGDSPQIRIKKSLLTSAPKTIPVHTPIGITGILTKDSTGFIINPQRTTDLTFGTATTAAAPATTKQTPEKLVATGINYPQALKQLASLLFSKIHDILQQLTTPQSPCNEATGHDIFVISWLKQEHFGSIARGRACDFQTRAGD